jgi:hypothetical protein
MRVARRLKRIHMDPWKYYSIGHVQLGWAVYLLLKTV